MGRYKIENIRYYTRLRDGRLKELGKVKPFISGSLVTIRRRCGNKRCRCTRGELHMGFYLTHKKNKKTKTIYVPVKLHNEVVKWIQEYKRIKKVMEDVTRLQRLIIRRFVKEKRRQRTT